MSGTGILGGICELFWSACRPKATDSLHTKNTEG